MSDLNEPMTDPLQLREKGAANSTRIARAAPHPDIVGVHRRLTSGEYADAHEVRLALLAHLIYFAYRDIKESIAL